MSVQTKKIQIQTKCENDIIDLSGKTSAFVQESNLKNGIVTVFVTGSTGAITTIEYEPGLKKDFPDMLKRIAPDDIWYEHENTWHDGNGRSHVKASLIGPSITIPFLNKKLLLGQWQHIVLVECDIHKRTRTVIIQIVGN